MNFLQLREIHTEVRKECSLVSKVRNNIKNLKPSSLKESPFQGSDPRGHSKEKIRKLASTALFLLFISVVALF